MPGDRRLMVLMRGGGETDGICELERLQWIAWQPGAYKNPLLVLSSHLEFPLQISQPRKIRLLLYHLSTFQHLRPMMVFVNMDSAQFYQPPKAAGMRNDGRPADCNLRLPTAHGKDNDPTALGPNKQGRGILQKDNTIGILDTTGSLPKEPLNPFPMPTLNLNGTEADPGGRVLCHLFKLMVTKASRYFEQTHDQLRPWS